VTVRQYNYRNIDGFLVCCKNKQGCTCRVFAHTKDGAKQIQDAIKQSDSKLVDKLLLEGK